MSERHAGRVERVIIHGNEQVSILLWIEEVLMIAAVVWAISFSFPLRVRKACREV